MDSETTPDERLKRKIARAVISEKRQYFVPAHGVSVDAKDVDDAVTKAEKASAGSAEKEGDE